MAGAVTIGWGRIAEPTPVEQLPENVRQAVAGYCEAKEQIASGSSHPVRYAKLFRTEWLDAVAAEAGFDDGLALLSEIGSALGVWGWSEVHAVFLDWAEQHKPTPEQLRRLITGR